jgi:hypothetical protein
MNDYFKADYYSLKIVAVKDGFIQVLQKLR